MWRYTLIKWTPHTYSLTLIYIHHNHWFTQPLGDYFRHKYMGRYEYPHLISTYNNRHVSPGYSHELSFPNSLLCYQLMVNNTWDIFSLMPLGGHRQLNTNYTHQINRQSPHPTFHLIYVYVRTHRYDTPLYQPHPSL